ncbi:helix-turn-helix domain-containing protein [Rhizobium sp. R339]|uniref:helix-turn-helix domain-containing protein n=1 Tax=Rhizobium sp. R339 TaxID=1764273 RepID=UPI00167E74C3|nr:helix-turn-helix domain-containing protein [Rhizobium sp. R339]
MDKILTIAEIAKHLKISARTAYAMAASGELPAFKVGGQWRMRQGDFLVWLDQLAGHRPIQGSQVELNDQRISRENIEEAGLMDEVALGDGLAVPHLTERLSLVGMHERFVAALGRRVSDVGPLDAKPLEISLGPPLPIKARVYMYNATRPPGGRPLGEHKVQLIVPGQTRGQRGSFDNHDGRTVLLVGYAAEEDVFILWDAGLYTDFAWSRNVQVKAETIIEATAGKLATQLRQLRPADGKAIQEVLIAAPSEKLPEAIDRRVQITRDRMSKD